MNEEAGESPLKSLINEVDVKIRKTNQKIDIADEILKKFGNAERDFESSLNELFKSIETPIDDLDNLNVLLDSFIESSADLQEVLETAKDLFEKPTM